MFLAGLQILMARQSQVKSFHYLRQPRHYSRPTFSIPWHTLLTLVKLSWLLLPFCRRWDMQYTAYSLPLLLVQQELRICHPFMSGTGNHACS